MSETKEAARIAKTEAIVSEILKKKTELEGLYGRLAVVLNGKTEPRNVAAPPRPGPPQGTTGDVVMTVLRGGDKMTRSEIIAAVQKQYAAGVSAIEQAVYARVKRGEIARTGFGVFQITKKGAANVTG